MQNSRCEERVTIENFSSERLSELLAIIDSNNNNSEQLSALSPVMHKWGSTSLSSIKKLYSDLGTDQFPLEFSLNFTDGVCTPRISLEAQSMPRTIQSNWKLGLKICEAISKSNNSKLANLHRIKDIFAPTADINAKFSIWFGVDFNDKKPVKYKAYLNPCINGDKSGKELVKKAMEKLEMSESWRTINEKWFKHRPQDHIKYFSIDLSDTEDSRIKIYVEHNNAKANDLDFLFEQQFDVRHFSIKENCLKMGLKNNELSKKNALTCFSFTKKTMSSPTLHFQLPIQAYIPSNINSRSKLNTLKTLSEEELEIVQKASRSLGNSLREKSPIQTWYAFKNIQSEQQGFTVYISTGSS